MGLVDSGRCRQIRLCGACSLADIAPTECWASAASQVGSCCQQQISQAACQAQCSLDAGLLLRHVVRFTAAGWVADGPHHQGLGLSQALQHSSRVCNAMGLGLLAQLRVLPQNLQGTV